MGTAGSGKHADDWFRSTGWDDAARAEFAHRLGRARVGSRAQYRRIKALGLLGTSDPVREAAGRALLEENLASPNADDFERVLALIRLAEQDQAAGRLDVAERQLRDALSISGPDGSGTTGEEEIQLAEILLERGGPERVGEAKGLLDRRSEEMPLFARSRLRLCVVQVRVALRIGDRAQAQKWAVAGLKVGGEEHSGLANHPKLGLVEADSNTMAWLKAVASGVGSAQASER